MYAVRDGKVVENTIANDPMRAVVTIEHADGSKAIYGHIESSVGFGNSVTRGTLLGTVRHPTKDFPGFSSHLHLGEWTKPSDKSLQDKKEYDKACVNTERGPIGWGRAPLGTTREQILKCGWVDLDSRYRTEVQANPAVPNAARTTPTTTPPVAVANMTLSDRLRGSPAYRRSFNALFAATPPTDRWLSRFVRGGGSVESPVSACDFGGRAYEYYSACEPHNCGDNQIHMFFTADGSRAWAHHLNRDSGNSRFYGNPDGFMQSAFEATERRVGSGMPACQAAPRPPGPTGPNAAQTTPMTTTLITKNRLASSRLGWKWPKYANFCQI
ncbi:MAG: peptidoglycan DD-metalloendopeptidase family protein [Dechloromonas sp.]|nr:MAG: peptidoglycan DD-metalloendopeptidase family protein [Dechloromonas sp.]